jgi:Uma2 family endonuclease
MALVRPTPAPGTWTYDDLLALPDEGKRYEIIEGVLYETPAPVWAHATVIANLMLLLGPIVQALGGLIRTASLDVFFPGGDPVQPDIVVLLSGGRAKPVRRGVQGPPDLVIEVLSPSNRGHDLLTKRAFYARAGVREYWIVDPEARALEILVLDGDALRGHQTASGVDPARSSLLPAAAKFPVSALFVGADLPTDDEA